MKRVVSGIVEKLTIEREAKSPALDIVRLDNSQTDTLVLLNRTSQSIFNQTEDESACTS
jgi:hypothetical protein